MSIEDKLPEPPEGWKWVTSLSPFNSLYPDSEPYIGVYLEPLPSPNPPVHPGGVLDMAGSAKADEDAILEEAEALLERFTAGVEKTLRDREQEALWREQYAHLLTGQS